MSSNFLYRTKGYCSLYSNDRPNSYTMMNATYNNVDNIFKFFYYETQCSFLTLYFQ